GGLRVDRKRRVHLIDVTPILAVAVPQQADADEQGECGQRKPAAPPQQPLTGGPRLFRNQHRLAKDHLLDKAGEKVAAALGRTQDWGAALIDAERASEDTGQPIERGSLLSAGSEIK